MEPIILEGTNHNTTKLTPTPTKRHQGNNTILNNQIN